LTPTHKTCSPSVPPLVCISNISIQDTLCDASRDKRSHINISMKVKIILVYMALNKVARKVLLFYSLYFVLFSMCYIVIAVPTKKNYQRVYDEFEAELPMRPVYKSFRSYTCPPWMVSEKQVNSRAEFLSITRRDDLTAIYKEREPGIGRIVYYVALSPTKYSPVLLVYKYWPTVKEIGNGFFNPKTYEIL